ncbi:C-3',4' desaturase CrtD [Synechococcus sp. CS-1328]|uniref:C-3',4' desaturase CrtD n=1 Tax=Synechococcus sp. CS-1328 TaxID=2847976 RepID=UPI00223C3139|nr:C-3',4' desaturase CrtD [Synechococcus sp. CS-1328]MCT0225399.1 C-3',4' desaturase CrtD [Synechococcus sp. CS-1328]
MTEAHGTQSQGTGTDGTDAHGTVVVLGAGIAGITAAALLARAGLDVDLLEAHHQSGGCAGTFRRGPYVFDVGATQVAGLEVGGIHARLFAHLHQTPPAATPLDPACVVDLLDGLPPVQLWRDPLRWQAERQRQFPGSERFWQLCAWLHRTNWAFALRDPVLPPRSLWDLGQLCGALRPATLISALATGATVADLLPLCGCGHDPRLRRYLDLQLKLYSQEPADRTAALYGATALAVAQEPQGLWHLEGSMQELSRALEESLARWGGRLRLRHRVHQLERRDGGWIVRGDKGGNTPFALACEAVVCTLPPQCLSELLGEALPAGYRQRLQHLHEPSGALVLYGAVPRSVLPPHTPSHLQLDWPAPGPLFVSVSQEGDGRAPQGQATVIASVFTPAHPWFGLDETEYQARKAQAGTAMAAGLEQLLGIGSTDWLHRELATPRGFAGWTGRPWGYVGGLGQHPSRFGPFGLASRTPLPGFWLGGDSIHPGEGTAGVSLSSLMLCRQLLAERRQPLRI